MKKTVLSYFRPIFLIPFLCLILSGCGSKKTSFSSLTTSSHVPHSESTLRGVLLPLSGQYKTQGESIKNGMLWACTQELTPSTSRIRFYDTEKTSVRDAYEQAMKDQVNIVLGPLTKNEVDNIFNFNHVVPIIVLNQNSQQRASSEPLYELSLTPEDDMHALADQALQRKANRALIIANHNPHFQRLYRAFSEAWKKSGKSITETFYYTNQTRFEEAIPNLLHSKTTAKKSLRNEKRDNSTPIQEQQRRRDFDVIILLAKPEEAQSIIPLLRYHYVINTPILASSSVYSGNASAEKNLDLTSVTICDIDWSALSRLSIPKEKQTRLFALGRDAVMLSQQMPQFLSKQSISLWVGFVKLDDHNQLIRTPHCQKIKNGLGSVEH